MHIALCEKNQRVRFLCASEIHRFANSSDLNLRVSEFETYDQLLFAMDIIKDPFSLIVLDVHESGAGIETVLRARAKGFTGDVIFLADTHDFILEAFDIGAFNYVLKRGDRMVDEHRFMQVVLRSLRRLYSHEQDFLFMNCVDGCYNVPMNTITYFESQAHQITAHFRKGEICRFIGALNRVEDELRGHGFFRIQRSYLVNLAAIARFDSRTVVLREGAELPLGRQRYGELKEALTLQQAKVIDIRSNRRNA